LSSRATCSGLSLPGIRHNQTSLPARNRGQQDDSHNNWT
jgi:hypothetical protein